jgi:hypothetical protein
MTRQWNAGTENSHEGFSAPYLSTGQKLARSLLRPAPFSSPSVMDRIRLTHFTEFGLDTGIAPAGGLDANNYQQPRN